MKGWSRKVKAVHRKRLLEDGLGDLTLVIRAGVVTLHQALDPEGAMYRVIRAKVVI